MNSQINHKIRKYQYKLDHATNKREASHYKAKLDSYKNRQAGGNDDDKPATEEEMRKFIGDTLNTNFQPLELRFTLMLNELQVPLNELVDRIVRECCKNKDCTQLPPQVIEKVKFVKEDWRKLIEELSKTKNQELTEKVVVELAKIKDHIAKLTCPPGSGAQKIFEAVKPVAEATQQMTEALGNPIPEQVRIEAQAVSPGTVEEEAKRVDEMMEGIKGGLFASPSPYNTEFSLFGSQDGGKRRRKQVRK
ncbi:hypothetical protein Indivirus_1_173 [Indivirus ILV1]|uniref:Uncharacterized protein n=1 Tax=Indivirus ILV1 TaxID=1977633 RepID=A0A1V0SCV0_9VIRU|nr:hypothetical protein Indivirus_1_173 [Indivirus ILV1]